MALPEGSNVNKGQNLEYKLGLSRNPSSTVLSSIFLQMISKNTADRLSAQHGNAVSLSEESLAFCENIYIESWQKTSHLCQIIFL